MNWKFTHVHHAFRRQAGISLNEYAVLDIIYKTQTHPSTKTVDGWADCTYLEIADFLGLSKGAVHQIVVRMESFGLLEVNPAHPKQKRTTVTWYENAYRDDDEGMENAAEKVKVQKMNAVPKVQKMNGKVQKMNVESSENELFRSENERNINKRKEGLSEGKKDAPNGASPKKPKKEKLSKDGNLIKAMASDFDVAFSYLSGTSKNLCWGAAATEKIRWSGKEIGNIANLRDALQKRMKEKQVDPTDKDTLENWRMFLQMSIDLKDDFLNRNFTPSFLYSQFNSIVLKLNQKKNGKHSSTGPTIISESTKRDAIRELFEEGYFDNGNKP